MDTATFNALPVRSLSTAVLAVSAGGIAVGSYFVTPDEVGQTGKRITYYMRIGQIRENVTISKVMPYTHRRIPGWIQGSNPPSKIVSKTDPYTGATINETQTITSSGAWPSGAIGYDTSGKTVQQLTYPDFPKGVSQQVDGYVRIYDVLTD